jgi:hypothetical protein
VLTLVYTKAQGASPFLHDSHIAYLPFRFLLAPPVGSDLASPRVVFANLERVKRHFTFGADVPDYLSRSGYPRLCFAGPRHDQSIIALMHTVKGLRDSKTAPASLGHGY